MMLTHYATDSIENNTLIATASRDDTHEADYAVAVVTMLLHIICVAQHEGLPSTCN